jgi:hypothetical protein
MTTDDKTERVVLIPIGTLLPFKASDGKRAQLRIQHVDRGRVILVPYPEGDFVLQAAKEIE